MKIVEETIKFNVIFACRSTTAICSLLLCTETSLDMHSFMKETSSTIIPKDSLGRYETSCG